MITTDIIGTIYTPGTYDSEGNVIDAPAPVEGYHVNTTHPVADWAAFKVTPASPRRVFGGGATHHYTFSDAAEFEAELDAADMSIPLQPVVPQMVTAIKAERDRRKFNGVKVGTKWIHTDTYSRTQWMAMVMMGASIPAIDWTTMDGTSVTTSQTLAGQVFQGTAQLDATLFGHAKALITQVEAAADPASVDIAAGWPATFESAA